MLVFNVEDVKVQGYPDVWGYIDVAVRIGVWLCLRVQRIGVECWASVFL
ncbi:MAG: hypothetical protein C5S33_06515 [ANME-2 cluster archaeon]|nr:hypothetical protein [ANME-2 cluster archaeon]